MAAYRAKGGGPPADYYKFHAIKRKYGLSREQFELMFDAQGGRCAICKRVPGRPLHVDHDHQSGRVRGLLCGPCNRALGLLDDQSARLLQAWEYLIRSETT